MQIRQDSSGRIQPTAYKNLLQPGTCALCGRVGRDMDEAFANLGVELEYYGIVYLCLNCCAEVADFIKFVSPERHEMLSVLMDKLSNELAQVKSDLARARMLLHARIDLAISGESHSDGFDSLPLSESESESGEVDPVLDRDKSEFVKSGTKH